MLINNALAKNVTRREFLQKSAQAALVLGGGLTFNALTGGCAALTFKEEAPVIYPPLKGHKVQPPKDSCMFGIRTLYNSMNRRALDIPHPHDNRTFIDYFTKELDQKPAIWAIQEGVGRHRDLFPIAREAASKEVIPFIYTGWPPISVLQEDDFHLRLMARIAREFGEQYGGFFINSMWEMNMESEWPWCGSPEEFKKAWREIWNIFEDAGANEYATWVIEYQIDWYLKGYYPGDDYVDWIGLSGYNQPIEIKYRGYRQLNNIITPAYRYFREKHPNKPLMLAEFGTTRTDQPKWLLRAFRTLKSYSGIKAAIYWDNVNLRWNSDHILSEEGIKQLKEILKDPYFI
jgi:hypothetical protein